MTFSIKKVNINNNKLTFEIKNIDVSILNSIRRIILSEIPNVAFEFEPYNIDNQKIIIDKNTCPLHNEIIQQRLSMIPLNFTTDEIIDFETDKYNFVLEKKNKTDSIIDITTEHIEIFDDKNKKYDDKFIRKIFPPNKTTKDFILITKLKPNIINKENGNEISIKMKATKDIAKNYSGFGYVSQCSYFNIIDEKQANTVLEKKIQDGKLKGLNKEEIVELEQNFETLEKHRIFKKNEYDEPSHFEFTVESECRVKPGYLFYKAIDIIDEKLNLLIKNIYDDNIRFEKVENSKNMYNLSIDNETHTLGNLIQSLLFNNFIRENDKKDINYIGYNCPHPLENIMIIKIQFTNDITIDECRRIFIGGLGDIKKLLNSLKRDCIKQFQLKNYSKDIL
jgi:DNA-directed RNA polymerase subunit L